MPTPSSSRGPFVIRHTRTLLCILFVFIYSVSLSYAVPPTTKYAPGTTLDPTCAPNSTNCSVQILASQTGNANTFLTSDGTLTAWSSKTLVLGGNFETAGNFQTTLTATGTTALTLPTSGTLATTANINSAVSGTLNYVPKYTSTNTIGNSVIYDDGTNIGVGTASPSSKLQVSGDIRITSGSGGQIIFADGSTMASSGLGSAAALSNITDAIVTGDSDANATGAVILKTASTTRLHILNTGNVGINTATPSALFSVGATSPFQVTNLGAVIALSYAGAGTGLTGTAASLTSGNVTTNANLTGDVTSLGNASTLATVNGNVGSFGSATQTATLTVNGKGLITAVSNTTLTPAIGSITGLGTGVSTALGINIGSAGSFIVNGGALGTPSSGVATNLTGTATGLTAGTVTTNANLTGVITSVGNATSIADAALSIAKTSGLQATLDLKAPLASPIFTGTANFAGIVVSGGITGAQVTSTGTVEIGDATKKLTINPYSDGNIYSDYKVGTSGILSFRTGQGAEAAAARNWMTVTSSTGAVAFTSAVTAPTFTGALTGNATTATTLATTRTIWGQNFNGSANVTGALTGVTDIAASGGYTQSGSTANTFTGTVNVPVINMGATTGNKLALYEDASNFGGFAVAAGKIQIGGLSTVSQVLAFGHFNGAAKSFVEQMRLVHTTGAFVINSTSDDGISKLQVTGGSTFTGNIATTGGYTQTGSTANTFTGSVTGGAASFTTGGFSGALTGTSATFSASNNFQLAVTPGTGTTAANVQFNNSGGSYSVGVDNSGGSITGTGYALGLMAPIGRPIILGVNASPGFRVNSDLTSTLYGALTGTSATFSGLSTFNAGTYNPYQVSGTIATPAYENIAKYGHTAGYYSGIEGSNTYVNSVGSGLRFYTHNTTVGKVIAYTIGSAGDNTWTGTGTFGGALTGTTATFSGTEAVRFTGASAFQSWYSGASRLGYIQYSAGSTDIVRETAHPIVFHTSNTTRYTIDASGNNTWTGTGTFGGGSNVTTGTIRIPNGGSIYSRFSDDSGNRHVISYGSHIANTISIAADATPVSIGGALTGTTAAFSGDVNVGTLSQARHLNLFITAPLDGKIYWSATAQPNVAWIGATGTPNLQAQVGGSGGVSLTSGATSWAAISDERLKVMDEFMPFANSLEKILTLRAGTTRYKTDPIGVSRSFLIAQDVQKILPEAVSVGTDEIKTLSLRYEEVIPLVVSAIQEMDIKVQALPEFEDPTLAVKIEVFLRGIAERGEAVVDLVTTKKVQTDELCLEDVCVTRNQFMQMIQSSGQTPTSSTPPPSDPTPEPTPEPQPDPVIEPTPTT